MTPRTKPLVAPGRGALLAGLALSAILLAFLAEWGREELAQHVIALAFRASGGSRPGLVLAGWLMYAAGPAAAVWYAYDFRRAVATARMPDRSRFAGRRRSRTGHRVRRSWPRRLPLAVPMALALAFLVPGGLVAGAPANWADLPGGADFMAGAKWSLFATFAAGAVLLLTEAVLLTEPKRWASWTASAVALLCPLVALYLAVTPA